MRTTLPTTLPAAFLGVVLGVVLGVGVVEAGALVVELLTATVEVDWAAEVVVVKVLEAEVLELAGAEVELEALVLELEAAAEELLLLLLPPELLAPSALILMLCQVPDWSPYEYEPAAVAPEPPM